MRIDRMRIDRMRIDRMKRDRMRIDRMRRDRMKFLIKMRIGSSYENRLEWNILEW